MWVAVALMVAVCAALLWLDARKPRNYPPGPLWVPLVGSAVQVRRERDRTGYLYRACARLLEACGAGAVTRGVLGLRVGKDRIVVVCGLDAVREMLLNEDIDGRPKGIFYETRTWGERRGIIMTDEDVWREQRRFIMKHLKEFGFGRRGMAETARAEAEHMLVDMRARLASGPLVHMHDFFNTYVLNTLWSMMAGQRYSATDPEMRTLQALLFELFAGIDMVGTAFSHFPLLRFLAPSSSGYTWFVDIHTRVWKFLRDELERHKQRFDESKEDRDFMDVYLRVLRSPEVKQSYNEGQLVATCMDMFMAGTETTSKSLGFGFLYLVRDRDVQRKAQAEIDAVLGSQRLVNLDDKPNIVNIAMLAMPSMPYNEAVSLECIRHFMGRTFGIPHRALRDTSLAGYTVPKDAMVISNFNYILMKEEHFPDAYAFRPERFLVDGKVSVSDKYFPFGIGKHRCMGEVLAKCNIFVFTVTLLQHFDFSVPPGEEPPTTNNIDGATPSAAPFRAFVSPRHTLL